MDARLLAKKAAIIPGAPARRTRSSRGAQFIELAFALPILLLLVMGAWDFGSAFLLQDKMTNAAREAARLSASNPPLGPLGAAQPCAQISKSGTQPTPCTIVAAVNALKLYMSNAGVDLSCIDSNSPTSTVGEQYTYTCAGVSGLQVVIDRGAVVDDTGGGTTIPLPSTRVTFTYPVTWWLTKLFPKNIFPATLTTAATMRNLT